MSDGYALRYLAAAMKWDFNEDNRETTWLRLMSDFKYDSYRDFLGGSRFPEALLHWIHQFRPQDRAVAYRLLREKLIFISFAEIQHLVNRTFPVFARAVIARRVAAKASVPPYLVWSRPKVIDLFQSTLKRTLFIGLSDGARIDAFRRANVGTIENDQVALGYEIAPDKWRDLLKETRKRSGDENAVIEVLFLIDDFTGSGKTLLRKEEDGSWTGKLKKLAHSFACHGEMFAKDCTIAVHHYIGTEKARDDIAILLRAARQPDGPKTWFPHEIETSFDQILESRCVIERGKDAQIDQLLDDYYDPAIETRSIEVGGKGAKFGFAGCGLPLILEHNTPNNSLALLWAESPPHRKTEPPPIMRPLFRRRQRHS